MKVEEKTMMKTMTLEEINFIRKTVFETVAFSRDVEIEFFDAEGISVEYDGKKAKIGADSRAGFARGCFLLAMSLDEGEKNFSIQEKAHFGTCGIMIDCSRNGVMKVEAVKKYMNSLAALGLNMLMLYTEDTYEIKNRPRFGYMRGRYTQEEIRQIVAYGERLGIELIPCIQTLGHLPNYLKWAKTCGSKLNVDTGECIDKIKNSDDTLLIGEEETYHFIEDEIRTCKEVFHSNKIHIGMDEAEAAFMGSFYKLNGPQPKFEVLIKHLNRVTDICRKYGLKPMMWSDMFFRSTSATGSYYDPTVIFPAELLEAIPDVELVYWDYGVGGSELYDSMIKKHGELNRPVCFANSFHTHASPLVHAKSAWDCGHEGLRVCVKNNIHMAMSTLWGDDGTPCNYLLANPLLPLLSEYCYKGEACTDEDIKRASEFLTKIPYDCFEAMGDANCIVNPERGWRLNAKRLLFGDVLYDMSCDLEHCDAIINTYGHHAQAMKNQMAAGDKNYNSYRYAYLIYEIGIQKAHLRINLQKAYLENDREYLCNVAQMVLPKLADTISELAECHRKQWESTYKMFGYEMHCFRYGGMVARLREVASRISRYLAGEISCIEELEAERIPNGLSYWEVKDLIAPSIIEP